MPQPQDGIFFVISVFLQEERGYSTIQTGLTLVPGTIGARRTRQARGGRRRA